MDLDHKKMVEELREQIGYGEDVAKFEKMFFTMVSVTLVDPWFALRVGPDQVVPMVPRLDHESKPEFMLHLENVMLLPSPIRDRIRFIVPSNVRDQNSAALAVDVLPVEVMYLTSVAHLGVVQAP